MRPDERQLVNSSSVSFVLCTHLHLSCNGSRQTRPTPPPSWSQSLGTACSSGSGRKGSSSCQRCFNSPAARFPIKVTYDKSNKGLHFFRHNCVLPLLSWRGRRRWGWWWHRRSSVPRPGTLRTSLCTSGWREPWWGWWRSLSASPWGPVQWHIYKRRI